MDVGSQQLGRRVDCGRTIEEKRNLKKRGDRWMRREATRILFGTSNLERGLWYHIEFGNRKIVLHYIEITLHHGYIWTLNCNPRPSIIYVGLNGLHLVSNKSNTFSNMF